MLTAINGNIDEEKEKEFQEDFVRDFVGSLYDIHIDGELHEGVPHWIGPPYKLSDDVELAIQTREACGAWDTTYDRIEENGKHWRKVTSKKIAEEVEIQGQDGELWYTSFPCIVGVFVRVLPGIIKKAKHDAEASQRLENEYIEVVESFFKAEKYSNVERKETRLSTMLTCYGKGE